MLLPTGTNALQQAHAAVTSSPGCLKCQWAGYLFRAKHVLKLESLAYLLYWQWQCLENKQFLPEPATNDTRSRTNASLGLPAFPARKRAKPFIMRHLGSSVYSSRRWFEMFDMAKTEIGESNLCQTAKVISTLQHHWPAREFPCCLLVAVVSLVSSSLNRVRFPSKPVGVKKILVYPTSGPY